MAIALTADHQDLVNVVRRFLADHDGRRVSRDQLDTPDEDLPAFWPQLASLGWLALHISEMYGGSGFSLFETGLVVEEFGRAVAPGPVLPTVWSSLVLGEAGSDAQREKWLPGLADGSLIGTICVEAGGEYFAVGAALAHAFLIPNGQDLTIVLREELDGIFVPLGVDRTRRVGRVVIPDLNSLSERRRVSGAAPLAVRIGKVLAACEASGIAHATTEMATAYAKERMQFGRLIGSFQAVKHHAANMLVDSELTTAAAWDGIRAQDATVDQAELASNVAVAIALPAVLRCTERNIQLHGGIGFTWEHDAHMYLRRAAALVSLFGSVREAGRLICEQAAAGVMRTFSLELPAEAAAYQDAVRSFRTEIEGMPADIQRIKLAESGYSAPHWPQPYGRGANAVEQIVIEQELEGIPIPELRMGAWIVPTILMHGTEDQVQRFARPTLEGDIVWCQLFSEPGAGSDAAGITTRADRVDGGWLVNGQKVWTTDGPNAHRGFATVRTNPDVPKHAGITIMAIDMKSPGVEPRPLREATGESMFSEVFLTDVFVPDDDVIGPVDGGWKVARSALAGERVSIGQGTTDNPVDLMDIYRRFGAGDKSLAQQVGALIAQEQAIRLLNLRSAERAMIGGEPGPEGNVAKLATGETRQSICELAYIMTGPAAALASGEEEMIAFALVWSRLLTLGGGTSEIVRNQIAELILGLPREPLIT